VFGWKDTSVCCVRGWIRQFNIFLSIV